MAKTYRKLQQENNTRQLGYSPEVQAQMDRLGKSYLPIVRLSPESTSPQRIDVTGTQYESVGDSHWDPDVYNSVELQHFGDIRAKEEPTILKWTNGIIKAVGRGATTFVDGWAGLIWGIGEGTYNAASGKSAAESFNALSNNVVSNALSDFNEWLAKELPNYRTEEEENNAWYQNLGTANFWADEMLNSVGFMVGAYFSGAKFAKALKSLNLAKSNTALKLWGSVYAAGNEARIESNTVTKDMLEEGTATIEDTYSRAMAEIQALPDGPEKEYKLRYLEQRKEYELQQLQENAAKAGLVNMGIQMPILALDNIMFMGRMFGRLGTRGSDLAGRTTTKAAETAEKAAKEAAKNKPGLWKRMTNKFTKAGDEIIEEEGSNASRFTHTDELGSWRWKDITKKESLLRGAGNALMEGNEELAQSFSSNFSTNLYTYNSPDDYYKSLTDPNAQVETSDIQTAAIEAWNQSYGNIDTYGEAFSGVLMGIFGMPTVGKRSNAGAETYLGRNKFIGLTGGIFGRLSSDAQTNMEGAATVEKANAFENTRGQEEGVATHSDLIKKMRDHANYFTQALHSTDMMNGFRAEDDEDKEGFFDYSLRTMFTEDKYEDADENDLFAMFNIYKRMGQTKYLEAMLDSAFDGLDDENVLKDIATSYTPGLEIDEEGNVKYSDANGNPLKGGWRTSDGTLMSDTEEGRKKMKEELLKRRDQLKEDLHRYNEITEDFAARGLNMLDDSEINELAWYRYKIDKFGDRFKKHVDNHREVYEKMLTALREKLEKAQEKVTYLENKYPKTSEKEEGEIAPAKDSEGKEAPAPIPESTDLQNARKVVQGYENNIKILEEVLKAENPIALGQIGLMNSDKLRIMKSDYGKGEFLSSGIASSDINDAINALFMISSIATASLKFNDRLTEFLADPNKLKKNREKIDKENENEALKAMADSIKEQVKNAEGRKEIAAILDNLGDFSTLIADELAKDPELSTAMKNYKERKKLMQAMNRAILNYDSIADGDNAEDAQTGSNLAFSALNKINGAGHEDAEYEQALDNLINSYQAIIDSVEDEDDFKELMQGYNPTVDSGKNGITLASMKNAVKKLKRAKEKYNQLKNGTSIADPDPTPPNTPDPAPEGGGASGGQTPAGGGRGKTPFVLNSLTDEERQQIESFFIPGTKILDLAKVDVSFNTYAEQLKFLNLALQHEELKNKKDVTKRISALEELQQIVQTPEKDERIKEASSRDVTISEDDFNGDVLTGETETEYVIEDAINKRAIPRDTALVRQLRELGVFDFIARGYLASIAEDYTYDNPGKELPINYLLYKGNTYPELKGKVVLAVDVTQYNNDDFVDIHIGDKKYQIVGIVGTSSTDKATIDKKKEYIGSLYNALVKEDAQKINSGNSSSNPEWFVSDNFHTSLAHINIGRMVLSGETVNSKGETVIKGEEQEQDLLDVPGIIKALNNNDCRFGVLLQDSHGNVDFGNPDFQNPNTGAAPGTVYLMVRAADGKYYPRGIRVKSVAEVLKNYSNAEEAETNPYLKKILENLVKFTKSSLTSARLEAKDDIIKNYIYLPEDIKLTFDDGVDASGNAITAIKLRIGEGSPTITLWSGEQEEVTEEVAFRVLQKLVDNINTNGRPLRFQINRNRVINDDAYTEDIVKSGIGTTNLMQLRNIVPNFLIRKTDISTGQPIAPEKTSATTTPSPTPQKITPTYTTTDIKVGDDTYTESVSNQDGSITYYVNGKKPNGTQEEIIRIIFKKDAKVNKIQTDEGDTIIASVAKNKVTLIKTKEGKWVQTKRGTYTSAVNAKKDAEKKKLREEEGRKQDAQKDSKVTPSPVTPTPEAAPEQDYINLEEGEDFIFDDVDDSNDALSESSGDDPNALATTPGPGTSMVKDALQIIKAINLLSDDGKIEQWKEERMEDLARSMVKSLKTIYPKYDFNMPDAFPTLMAQLRKKFSYRRDTHDFIAIVIRKAYSLGAKEINPAIIEATMKGCK